MADETPDQARTRRRWISLAEVVAVAGLIIAALGFWNSWSERRDASAQKEAATAAETRDRERVDLKATAQGGGDRLLVNDAKHDLQSVTFAFPRALGIAPQQPVADAVIDAAPISGPLLKMTDGGPDDREGRLPVLITTHWLDGDTQRSATDIYDLIWRTHGRHFLGRKLTLEGLRSRQRGGTQGTLDHLWTKP